MAAVAGLNWSLGLAAAEPEPQGPRAARSVHLWWTAPEGDVFYNEMEVLESTRGSYFMACGWNTGYFGVQELGRGRKVVLFSVWDAARGDDANAVAAEERVRVLHEGEGVRVSRFGGEGTGGKCMFDYDWKLEERCRFLVRSSVNGEWTSYSGYFYLTAERQWKHLVTFQTRTGGKPLQGYYSFVEDFRRDGRSPLETRRAAYGSGWVRTTGGDWVALTRAKFTADRTPLDNIDAGLRGEDVYLATGGAVENRQALRSTIVRLPAGPEWPEAFTVTQ
jgi:hypothetical protein